jgi:hypothetical protein
MQIKKWAIFALNLYFCFFLLNNTGNTKESAQNKPPSSPDTGSPEADFSPGGSRDNDLLTRVCGEKKQKIAFLLGNNNREFTLSAHPTFWFYVSPNIQNLGKANFVLRELETGKKIYNLVVEVPKKGGMIGISVPKVARYALSANVNYSWRLKIDCTAPAAPNEESVITLEGWLQRLSLDSNIERQLATVSLDRQYQIYLQHNLLYDALNNLAQHQVAEPHNAEVKKSWNRLLNELGWHELALEQRITPFTYHCQLPTKIKADQKKG